MITTLIAAALVSNQEAFKHTYVFSGMPTLIVPADSARPEILWHTVTITLSHTTAKVETTTLYKNIANRPAPFTISLPVYSVGDVGKVPSPSVTWGDKALSANSKSGPYTFGLENVMFRNRGATQMWQSGYSVSLPAKAQQSLKTTITVPVSHIDHGGVARQVTYRLEAQPNMLERLQVAIKYSPTIVFSPIGATPDWGQWQIGANGAYMKRDKINLPEAREVTFQYYPNQKE